MLRYANKWRKWALALQNVILLAGWSNSSYRSKSVEEIVETISLELSSVKQNDARNLIGIKPHAQHFIKDLLKIGSGGVRMIGIYGASGGGKTTLAMAIYNEISCKFSGRCSFIENLKDDSRELGLAKLQEKVLTDVFKLNGMKIMSIGEGKHLIKERMGRFGVLIVLDDVDDISQLDALAGSHVWFGNGSRIIITTKEKSLLEAHGVDSIHQIELLKDGEALELFNSYAAPKKEYEKLSLEIVSSAGDLPLTFKVLGSFLHDKEENVWTSALNDLMLTSTETLKKLKISYDALESDEKEIFLDLAIFFKNRKKSEVLDILSAFGYKSIDNMLQVLVDKSLISTISDGRVQIHDLIQEMARCIILEDLPKKHSRIWQVEQLLKIRRKVEAAKINGIQVKFDNERPMDFSDMFTDMKNLRYLDINTSHMSKADKEPKVFSSNLRWLSWSSYPGKYLPQGLQAKELVVICMANSKIRQFSKRKNLGLMPKLKILDLSGSKYLTAIASFERLPNLERLILQNCSKLVSVDPSIGYLKELVLLDMSCCSKLQSFPPIVQMTSLKVLIFSGCTKLTEFPEIYWNMDCLEHLNLQNTRIQDLSSAIGKVSNLISIDLCNCQNLTNMYFGFCPLLRSLKLSGCPGLKKLPVGFFKMQLLEELILDYTGIREFPAFILNLPNLKTLSFRRGDEDSTSKTNQP
ncbi:hypothetical protein CTI12_AA128840 [Artemisia annua]|nr:hypothetical protein CTI12_AA128840 [Artemisia annua]